MPPVADPDPELVRRARAGDVQAFEALVRHYQDAIYALAYRRVYDAELARDIAQDVFLRLYERIESYDPQRPFGPWFMTLAVNYTLNARQKARLRKTQSLDAPLGPDGERRPEPADAEATSSADAAAGSEARAGIRAAIRELPDKYAAIVVLHYLEGLGVAEIGERLAMPVGTVKIRLHRARNLLRGTLKRFGGS